MEPTCSDTKDHMFDLGDCKFVSNIEPIPACALGNPVSDESCVNVQEGPLHPYQEFSELNHIVLLDTLLQVKENAKFILEIGVNRNPIGVSSTGTILDNKLSQTVYLGIDIADKRHLNSISNNVYTLRMKSDNVEVVKQFMQDKGLTHIDLLHIDGWHSIDTVLKEWAYVHLVREGGFILMHDVALHPGPRTVFDALDEHGWIRKERYWVPGDWGVGLLQKAFSSQPLAT
eukprot:CAMPEP_0196571828 /NCGR_PEP_ID=MMETSP1081-20130531/1966_1 /TAXON_ID=36882 /ORGANISM="Pyramimonas amylifera, Strain CCMP720" /LENGTH=229 /DNA_ID=CAMNT_0041888931 /DNA_START=493 /DNA_END=1182 /DNA_ORIENTATION=-